MLGATLERDGRPNDDGVNLLSTLVAAALAVLGSVGFQPHLAPLSFADFREQPGGAVWRAVPDVPEPWRVTTPAFDGMDRHVW